VQKLTRRGRREQALVLPAPDAEGWSMFTATHFANEQAAGTRQCFPLNLLAVGADDR